MRTWASVAHALRSHGRCALVSVVATRGSVPRETGAHMVVTPDGYFGTVGGGTLEWKAIAAAQAMLPRGTAQRLSAMALGPDLGQCCGGHVELAIDVFTAESLLRIEDLAAREAAGAFSLTRTVAGRQLEERFGEIGRPVYLFGAGHVGRALVMALAVLPFAVTWADPRPNAFPRIVPQNVTMSAVADPTRILSGAPEGAFAFVMSHSHALDLAIVDVALRNPAIAHVGVIGSATKRARFERRLRAGGVPDTRISGLICPIGVPGIASKLPAAIAAATAAQILVLDSALSLAMAAPNPQNSMACVGMGR
jgi:xanthine dehydrogenase accessory factor